MAKHNELGRIGENEAAAYLEANGYLIRHRNWRFGQMELDIVAEKDGELIIVEVKTRRNRHFGNPEEAVDDRKIRRIVSSAEAYLTAFNIDLPVRFDVITAVGNVPPLQIEHIQEAFFPPIW